MKWILLQIICMSIVGFLILFIRKSVGKKLYPWVTTLLWVVFFVSALVPLTVVKDIKVYSQSESEGYVYGVYEGERFQLAEARGIGDLVTEREYNVQILQLIQMVWLMGVIVFLLYKGCALLLLQKRLNGLGVVYDTSDKKADASGIGCSGLLEVMQKYPISTRVIVTEDFGPAVYGLKGKIFIPYMLCTSEAEVKSILLHEYTHVKRRHAFILVLSEIVSILYWFAPYVRKLFLPALREDMEYRCDYEVINKYGIKAKEYALHYVNTIETTHLTANELAFRKEALRERVDYILKRKGHRKISMIISMMALILLFGGLVGMNVYYQMPNHNGHSRAEIEEAMEVILEYSAAYERGDVEAIQNMRVDKFSDESLKYNQKYYRVKVYSMAYDEKLNSYSKKEKRAAQYGDDKLDFICIDGIGSIKNRWDFHDKIHCYWILVRDGKNSPWMIAEVGK